MKRWAAAVVVWAVVIVALALLIAFFHVIVVHLSQETGTSDSTSRAYDFWSGFGSDLGEATIIVGVVTAGRHVNCHTRGCWRVTLHRVTDPSTGHEYRQCIRHDPHLARHAHGHFWQHHFSDEHLSGVHARNAAAQAPTSIPTE